MGIFTINLYHKYYIGDKVVLVFCGCLVCHASKAANVVPKPTISLAAWSRASCHFFRLELATLFRVTTSLALQNENVCNQQRTS